MIKILVTGATGNVGSQVVRALQVRGVPVRAFVRNPDAAAKLGNVELVIGDFADSAALRRAMEGVERVFLTSADGPDKVAHERAVIDAAAEAGVQLLVKLSTVHAQAEAKLPTFAWHGEIEHYLHRSNVPAVVLRSTFFMTNLLMNAGMVAETGQFFAPAGDGRVAMIHPADVAAAAAALLSGGGHVGRTYEITGGNAITFADVARALAAVMGRSVTYVNVPPEAAPAAFQGSGLPEWLVTQLLGVFALIRQGAYAEASESVQMLTGQQPRTIGDFARDYAVAFGLR
ncbi:MAG: SDR family oxidoreductase [Chloroflexaceae bacterium]|nr:SDR family oxidoreductase [Chloroflexaceae bacterium]